MEGPLVGTFTAILGVQVVATSQPTIRSAFAISPDQTSQAYVIIAIP